MTLVIVQYSFCIDANTYALPKKHPTQVQFIISSGDRLFLPSSLLFTEIERFRHITRYNNCNNGGKRSAHEERKKIVCTYIYTYVSAHLFKYIEFNLYVYIERKKSAKNCVFSNALSRS